MQLPNNYRKQTGAVLGLIAGCIIVLFIIGAAFVLFIQTVSGDKQLVNATDAGALAAAQQILTVGLTPSQISQLPNEFKSYGVDQNGVICQSGKDSNGNPAIFNEIAYNNCAGYTIQICLNAALDGSPNAISNANNVIAALNKFAKDLDANLQASPNLANAASDIMANNSISNLPGNIFTDSQKTATLVPGSVKLAYYAGADASSNVTLPAAFISKDPKITKWVNSFLSKTSSTDKSSKYLAAANAFDLNKITGQSGFAGTIALVPFRSTQLTHLVTSQAGNNFSTSLPGITNLPHNCVQLVGQSNSSGAPSSGNSNSTQITNQNTIIGAGNNKFNLTATSAAVVNGPQQVIAYIPSYNPAPSPTPQPVPPIVPVVIVPPVTTPPTPTAAAAYIAIINGGDMITAMNNSGYSAAVLQQQGYTNINLTTNTSIAYDASNPDIFDIFDWAAGSNGFGLDKGGNVTGTSMLEKDDPLLLIGTETRTGLFDKIDFYRSSNDIVDTIARFKEIFPPNNYSGITDNPGLTSKNASIPFALHAPYIDFSKSMASYPNTTAPGGTSLSDKGNILYWIERELSDWIRYNRSKGRDGLGHDENLDPLKAAGGSPKLHKSNPNATVPNSLIHATSGRNQLMTISDAIKIVDYLAIYDPRYAVFDRSQPAWLDGLLPVMAANYGYNYLPISLSETKSKGLTGIEYAKAQLICLHAGLGLSNSHPVCPSLQGKIFLPGKYVIDNVNHEDWWGLHSNVQSGLRYYTPYDSTYGRAHYAWPEPAGAPKFERNGTPWEILDNIRLLYGDWEGFPMNPLVGLGSPYSIKDYSHALDYSYALNYPYYTNLLNTMMTVVKQWDDKLTIADLASALDTKDMTIELGQTLYLIYDSSQKKLVLVNKLPDGEIYQPADSKAPSITIRACYTILDSGGQQTTNAKGRCLLDTDATPGATVKYNGQNVCTAPYGDSKMAHGPFPVITGCNSAGQQTIIYATDVAEWWPSSGANNNHGEIHFYEIVGGQNSSSLGRSLTRQLPPESGPAFPSFK